MNRRIFVRNAAMASAGISFFGLAACGKEKKEKSISVHKETPMKGPFFRLSLAQWSIHRMIREEGLDPFEFAAKAKGWGFEGLEYVTQLYEKTLEKPNGIDLFVRESKLRSADQGMKDLIIMVDHEGDLAVLDEGERNKAIDNHKKWMDAAAAMGCHSIRINLFGTNDPEEWKPVSIDSLGKLGEYGEKINVAVLVENHGWLSSNGQLLSQVMRQVNHPYCGTLPDFGNFCIKRKDGSRWGECEEEYERYKGMEEIMPFAKAVSAKSYDFDDAGNETTIDYERMLRIVNSFGYKGFIGVEYEGKRLSEEEGILATKDLLIKAAQFA